MSTATAVEATWHDVECGGYSGDLATWTELAGEAGGPLLELGAGTGRLAMHLTRRGFEVTAIERSPALIAELRRRAKVERLTVEAVEADARDFKLAERFSLIAAPMQLAHLLGGSGGRRAMLGAAAAHLRRGGAVAVALLAERADPSLAAVPPLPDVLERDGWIYSSQPLDARRSDGGVAVRRLRQLVSPEGELREQVDVVRLDDLDPRTLEGEAAAAGLAARERIEIPPTADHVGSVVCVLEQS